MNAERFARLKRLFLVVADLPADERRAYLDEACADDAELRREIERLLASDRRPDELLATGRPPAPGPEHPPDRSAQPRRVPAVAKIGKWGCLFLSMGMALT